MTERFFPLNIPMLQSIVDWSAHRTINGPDPSHGARPATDLARDLAGSVSPKGIGGAEALRRFDQIIVPATRAQDEAMNLAYVAAAPTPAALTFDIAVSAAEIFGGTWETGAGAIAAENQALRWISDLAGFPDTAGGVFVSGGTIGNLSALHAARERARDRNPGVKRWRLATTASAHSSIAAAAKVLDVDVCAVGTDDRGRMTGQALADAVGDVDDVFAVLATAGTTNAGIIDHLSAIADLCSEKRIWLHVDGALGLAAMASPSARPRFDGIDRADSFVVDPHKWLFAPYDCCALIYREPVYAAAAHSQIAPYLDQIDRDEWNPADYAIHLSRRVRGLPLWFSLATYGTDMYAAAIDKVLLTVAEIVAGIEASDVLELVEMPDLNVILYRRPDLDDEAMVRWAEAHRKAGTILCLPTSHDGAKVFRLCLVNPDTEAMKVLGVIGGGFPHLEEEEI